MILDLLTFSSILSNVVDLLAYCFDNGIFSIKLLLLLIVTLCTIYIAWRTTDIPQDVPSAPTSPFFITIQNSSNTNSERRQSLSDIRIVTTNSYADILGRHPFVGRRLPRATITLRSRSSGERSTNTSPSPIQINGNSSSAQGIHQNQQQVRSVLFGFLRHSLTRGWVPVYNRFNLLPRGLYVFGHVLHQRRHQQHRNNSHVTEGQNTTASGAEQSSEINNPNQGDSPNQSEQSTETTINSDSTLHSELGSLHSSDSETEIVENSVTVNSVGNYPVNVLQTDGATGTSESAKTVENFSSSSVSDGKRTSDPYTAETTLESHSSSATMNSTPEIKFTLKFLNDTQLEVTAHSGDKIIDFKRQHFSRELSENKTVRLIFNGRVLDQDNRTLQEGGIYDQCVVHCLVVTPQQQSNQQAQGGDGGSSNSYGDRNSSSSNRGPRGPEPGMFFVTVVGILLMFLWFVCINFGNHLFTQSAVVSLSVLTGIFILGVIIFYLPTQQDNVN